MTEFACVEEALVEIHALEADAVAAEGMEERAAGVAPVVEADAEFESALRALDEVELVESEIRVEVVDVGDAGLAHSDGADRRRVHQRDRRAALGQEAREAGRGAPARGAATDDDDRPNHLI